MSERNIVDYIKRDEDLYEVFQIIADIENTDNDNFSSKAEALETIKRIFRTYGMDNNGSDSSVGNISYNGFDMIGYHFLYRERVCFLYILIDCIQKLSHRIMNEHGICIVATSFAFDSRACIVFAVEEVDRDEDIYEQEYELMDKVKEYVENVVEPGWRIYSISEF